MHMHHPSLTPTFCGCEELLDALPGGVIGWTLRNAPMAPRKPSCRKNMAAISPCKFHVCVLYMHAIVCCVSACECRCTHMHGCIACVRINDFMQGWSHWIQQFRHRNLIVGMCKNVTTLVCVCVCVCVCVWLLPTRAVCTK